MPDRQTKITADHSESVEVYREIGPVREQSGDNWKVGVKWWPVRMFWAVAMIIALIIALIIGSTGLIQYFPTKSVEDSKVDVKLDVYVNESMLNVKGSVTNLGQPVGGETQVTIERQRDGKYLGSEVARLNDGRFAATFPQSTDWIKGQVPLIITADYSGRDQLAVKGAATRYWNTTAPPSPWVTWLWSAVLLFILGLLVYLFAVPLSTRNARLLFGLTYVITFVACALPLAAVKYASENPYLRSQMESSSVGILLATTPPATTPPATTEPAQWWVILGGDVAYTDPQKPPELKGGVAVPLFVLILALLGAAINLTREVPKIQKDSGFDAPNRKDRDTEKEAETKRRLIEVYMYLLSAPVLAIAVYYLLQAVMGTVGKPTLVLVAFATGLMTNTATGAIISFADDVFRGLKEKQEAKEKRERKNSEKAAKEAAANASANLAAPGAGTSHLPAQV